MFYKIILIWYTFPYGVLRRNFSGTLQCIATHCPTTALQLKSNVYKTATFNTTYSYPGGVTDPDFGTIFIETQLWASPNVMFISETLLVSLSCVCLHFFPFSNFLNAGALLFQRKSHILSQCYASQFIRFGFLKFGFQFIVLKLYIKSYIYKYIYYILHI